MPANTVDTSNNVNVIDESYEDTYLYSWEDGTMKQVPYDEYTAKTGHKVKTFLNFKKNLKVIIVNVNNTQMILTVWNGNLNNGELNKGDKPVRFKASDHAVVEGNVTKHRVSMSNPILMFSLNKDRFGKQIKPKLASNEI